MSGPYQRQDLYNCGTGRFVLQIIVKFEVLIAHDYLICTFS